MFLAVEPDLQQRLKQVCLIAWSILANQIAHGRIKIYKEASLQHNYALILRDLGNLMKLTKLDAFDVELERTFPRGKRFKEIDVLVTLSNGTDQAKMAIEMKCYRYLAASGGKSGAVDIFMRELYLDIESVEEYIQTNCADQGLVLVANDYANIVTGQLRGKQRCYLVCQGHKYESGTLLNVVVGEKKSFQPIRLINDYTFCWSTIDSHHFMAIEVG